MVLDALTALSLAGTVVQFVDFSSKLLAKGHEIYVSVDGASIGNSDIETATRNLRDLNVRLNASTLSRHDDVGVNTSIVSEVALAQLTTKCSAVADELLEVLHRLKIQGGSNRRWKSFRQALKSALRQGKVDELNSRLQTLRQELSFNVLVSFREDLDLLAIKSSAGFATLETTTQELAEKLLQQQQRAFADQTNIITYGQERTNQIVEAQHHQTRREIIETIQQESSGWHRRGGDVDDDDEHPAKIKLVTDLILESLRFQTIDDRYEEIEPAHKKTFGWIFKEPELEKPWADFPQWLSTGKGIYWINGKAASGKSTIMKYAFHDPRTQSLLGYWTGQHRLIKVSHYFWNSGTADQRSHAGLLRSLLYKVLNQCEFLIPEIFPEVWKDRISKPLFLLEEMGAVSWTLPKLSQAFDRLLSTKTHGLKFCLFVDGLDEYDGDYYDIIKIFTRISESSNVKVCLSSRPLSDFVVAFKACPSLRLQDLTFGDIQEYINHELSTNMHMQSLRESNPQVAQSLVSEIVSKADGVFLWVKLVVLSLLRGLRQCDDIQDLQVRLKLLPPSLEDLFSHILGRLDPVYLEQSSRIFQIFAEAQKINHASFTSLELSFAEELDSKRVIQESTRQLSAKELQERFSRVDIWLRTRCGGLIEQHSGEDAFGTPTTAKLSYLHRTVRDFLELPEIWTIVLKPTVGKEFVPSIALLQSQVLYIKWVLPVPCSLKQRIDDFQKFANRALAFAKLAEQATKKPQMLYLSELDRVCTNLLEGFVKDSHSWTTLPSTDDSGILEWTDKHQNSLIALAVKFGLYHYVDEKLKLENWHVEKGGRPLLHYAVTEKNDLCKYGLQVEPDIIELLLKHGAQPGEVYEKISAWELVLEQLFVLLARGGTKKEIAKWLSIVKLFIEHGADPTQCLGGDSSKLAYSLVHALCDEPHEVKALLVSPGILAERAEKARRDQLVKEPFRAAQSKITNGPVSNASPSTVLKDFTRENSSTDAKSSTRSNSSLIVLKESAHATHMPIGMVPVIDNATPRLKKETVKHSSPEATITPSFSLWSINEPEVNFEVKDDPERCYVTEEPERRVALALENAKPTYRPRSQSYEPKPTPISPSIQNQEHRMSISPTIQYREQIPAFRPPSWTQHVEVSKPVYHTSPADDQTWSSEPSHWGPRHHQPRQPELPPPLPPKIPILLETCYELQGSPVATSSPQAFDGNQSISQPLPLPSRPRSTNPTPWGALWRVEQPSLHDSRGHLTPVGTSAPRFRPHSAQGISVLSQQSNQPSLSHHRSYNSFSFAQNVTSQAIQSAQYENDPYPRPPPSRYPYPPSPIEDRNYSTPIYSQPVHGPPSLYVNTTYVTRDPYRETPGQDTPIPEHLKLQSPNQLSPNSYPLYPSFQSRPRAVSSPRQHHQEFLPDLY